MKKLIKKLLPKQLFSFYHRGLALFSAFIYGFPSEKMIVIGVTGTNGKTTTVNLIAKLLSAGGDGVGATSTVNFIIKDKEWLNDKKMTMLGRFQLQKLLRQMVTAGCRYAVIETSSQGIEQYRHLGINYDYLVFTNLTPEHIEAHGGFENYKKAKGKLFAHLMSKPNKQLFGREIKKTILVNADDEYASYFLSFPADVKLTYGLIAEKLDYQAQKIQSDRFGTAFQFQNIDFKMKLLGQFNVYNVLPALVIAGLERVALELVKPVLEGISVIPGRMELIDVGQNFGVLVDYAPEPYSLTKLYEALSLFDKKRLIHVLGSCGGGRDMARRPILGKMAGKYADLVIVTNEDPYDEDPEKIIDEVLSGAFEAGKRLDENLFRIIDRAEAIKKAINLANDGDLVLITGKGAEQAMAVANGRLIPWDDRDLARRFLRVRQG